MTGSSLEVELKFLINKDYIAAFQGYLSTICEPSETLQLANIYFDTPEGVCHKNRMGLRIRRWNDQCEQTIKMSGKVSGEVSERPEYTTPCKQELPDLTLFPADIWPTDFVVNSINANLQEQFRTDFERQRWIFQADDLRVEVALDQGKVKAGGLVEPICEVEFELLAGDLQALASFVADVRQHVPLAPGTLSKAQRGYLLLEKALQRTEPLGSGIKSLGSGTKSLDAGNSSLGSGMLHNQQSS